MDYPDHVCLEVRLHTHASWDDLVLPAPVIAQLRRVAGDVQAHVLDDWSLAPGRNVNALFAGPPGTGKTLAAQVIAHELALDLCCVGLVDVASRYIGETEKNLARIFDTAAGKDVVLFFDEADALFGKRSEAKDPHDRHANYGAAYLLQRIEAHSGLLILATSSKAALDPAFTRRLRHLVDFPFPGTVERKAIWARMFPGEVSAGELDIERLARFPLSGGTIHAIALDAGLRAAQHGSVVTPALIFEATRRALEKSGQPIGEEDSR